MVQYTVWTSVVHEAFQDLGGDYESMPATEVTSQAAAYWQENKGRLRGFSRSEAYDEARSAFR